jgi:hypothetical protein
MLRLEFHCHTIYSKDSLTSPEKLIAACQRKKIDRLVVTDHNTIAGALRCQELNPQLVIVGEEIATQAGELLAAFVQEEVPSGLPPREAILRLREQGAFISVSHPFDTFRKGHWPQPALLDILSLVDAIETFNARCLTAQANTQAQSFAQEHGVMGTVGSDAHTLFELGRATMLLPDFHDAASLKAALPEAKFHTRLSSPWVHITSRYASWKKSKDHATR